MKRHRPHGSTRHAAPHCLEVINIRLYEPSDRHTVMTLYERMAAQYPDARFTLFRNAAVEGDWSIHVWRPRASREEPKSP